MEIRASAGPSPQKLPNSPQTRLGWLQRRGTTALLSMLIGAGLAYLYVMSQRGSDVAPDNIYGYGFAIAGTLLLTLVGVGYALRKRLRRNWSGMLHTAVTWHVLGGLFGLALIMMHAMGNFHPRTGTYALYGLIALVVSGFIGKLLDRFAPRMAAKAALETLTADGEERLEVLVDALHVTRRGRRDNRRQPAQDAETGIPWDLAYYDLGAQPNEIPSLLQQSGGGASGQAARQPGSAAELMSAGVAPGMMASESAGIRSAIGRERLYLHLVRVWRWIHTVLSLVTLGLILWHLEYAIALLMNTR